MGYDEKSTQMIKSINYISAPKDLHTLIVFSLYTLYNKHYKYMYILCV